MEGEHCDATDSDVPFETSNYGIRTTSKTEWLFVAKPREVLDTGDWPKEVKLTKALEAERVDDERHVIARDRDAVEAHQLEHGPQHVAWNRGEGGACAESRMRGRDGLQGQCGVGGAARRLGGCPCRSRGSSWQSKRPSPR